MSALPSVLLLLDLSAIMASTTREWQEYSRVGKCHLPQTIYEEIEFLCNRAPEPDLEKTAREFMRFYPESGWQLTSADATHPSITPPSGQALSKNARLALLTAQCGYGLSRQHSDKLVVFVANSQPLLQKIQALGAHNLCGITSTALLQWSRTRQRPPAVTQQMQVMTQTVGALASGPKQGMSDTKPQRASSPPPMTGPASAARTRFSPQRRGFNVVGFFRKLIGNLLTLVILATLGLTAWRFAQPASFNKFWYQLNLPTLPGQQLVKPPKPAKK